MLLNKKFPIIAGVIIVSIIAVTLIITQDTDNIESSLNEEGYTLVNVSPKKEGTNWVVNGTVRQDWSHSSL